MRWLPHLAKLSTGQLSEQQLSRLWTNLHALQKDATPILIDSHNAIDVAQNPMFHAHTKHIEIHYHYVKEWVHEGEVNVIFYPTQDIVVDIFSKAPTREKFETFHKALNLIPFSDLQHLLYAMTLAPQGDVRIINVTIIRQWPMCSRNNE